MPNATKDPGPIQFTGKILPVDSGLPNNGLIEFPYDLKETYGIGNLVPVVITFDSHEYRGSIVKMGSKPVLLIRKDLFALIGKQHGDNVDVVVKLDQAERTVEVPDYFEKELIKHGLKEGFDKLAFTHRREYVQGITEAKQEETRVRRIEKAIRMIKEKTAGK